MSNVQNCESFARIHWRVFQSVLRSRDGPAFIHRFKCYGVLVGGCNIPQYEISARSPGVPTSRNATQSLSDTRSKSHTPSVCIGAWKGDIHTIDDISLPSSGQTIGFVSDSKTMIIDPSTLRGRGSKIVESDRIAHYVCHWNVSLPRSNAPIR
jgi:hypothetical protein